VPLKRGWKVLSSVWDNDRQTLYDALEPMTTTIQYADLVESIAASLQYIS